MTTSHTSVPKRSLLMLAAGLGAAALLLTGCPPPYPKCSNDEGCKEHGEVCVQGACQECATDANCKDGFVCQATKCVPKPECADDAACGTGRKCSAGKCVVHECESNADCKNATCQQNRCVLNPGACNQPSDCPGGQDCKAGLCEKSDALGGQGGCNFDQPIRFGFNEYTVSPEARQSLTPLADCVRALSGTVRLEGHADERGTEEFNLQLSNKRAAAVKRYLTDLGVPGKKLETVGYGENKPANNGHDEAAWADNRRVELKK